MHHAQCSALEWSFHSSSFAPGLGLCLCLCLLSIRCSMMCSSKELFFFLFLPFFALQFFFFSFLEFHRLPSYFALSWLELLWMVETYQAMLVSLNRIESDHVSSILLALSLTDLILISNSFLIGSCDSIVLLWMQICKSLMSLYWFYYTQL